METFAELNQPGVYASLPFLLGHPVEVSFGFSGYQMQPREIAFAGKAHWSGVGRVKWTATMLGESNGYIGAYHDNARDGVVWSRDCGFPQSTIPARLIGTETEAKLRTDSTDPDVYRPVVANATKAAHDLYIAPMTRDGELSRRYFSPWYAYTTGWATFREWWTWHQEGGEPVGPWIKTGRFLQRAIPGAANSLHLIEKTVTEAEALTLARRWADTFKVKGTLALKDSPVGQIIYWRDIPAKPTAPPVDGIGPRPHQNDGR